MPNHKARLAKLEQQRGAGMPEVVIVTIDGGAVVEGPPELLGKTAEELDALYAAREDVKLVAIVYASDFIEQQEQ